MLSPAHLHNVAKFSDAPWLAAHSNNNAIGYDFIDDDAIDDENDDDQVSPDCMQQYLSIDILPRPSP